MVNIAILGAGLCGLTVAHKLKPYANVTIFEKARGVGGRMSTKRAEPFYFDQGAQFFTVKTAEFESFISLMLALGIVQRWDARFAEFQGNKLITSRVWDKNYPHYVGVPGMNAIAKYLAQSLNIQLNTKIIALQYNNGWNLIDDQHHLTRDFDWIISTIPAPQTMELIPKSFKHYSYLTSKQMMGCLSLMLGFEQALSLDFDAALVRDADISWISVNSSKPERNSTFSLVTHSTNKWAEDHLYDNNESIIDYLCSETSRIVGFDVEIADYKAIHRWRYANIEKQSTQNILIDVEQKLAVCGDWCVQGRVEAAFISGLNMANHLLNIIN